MGGFLSSLIMEGVTGKGTLQQVGLLTPNPLLLTFILAATSGVTVFGTGRTIARAQTGNMSKECVLPAFACRLSLAVISWAPFELRLEHGVNAQFNTASPTGSRHVQGIPAIWQFPGPEGRGHQCSRVSVAAEAEGRLHQQA